MTNGNSPAAVPADRTLTTSRVFDAPRERVFKAWTDPKQFARWFPPEGFTTAVCELDVRPGGSLRVDMQGADPALGPDFYEKVFPGKGVYREVVANERLAFTFEAEAEKGEPPVTMLMTVISRGCVRAWTSSPPCSRGRVPTPPPTCRVGPSRSRASSTRHAISCGRRTRIQRTS